MITPYGFSTIWKMLLLALVIFLASFFPVPFFAKVLFVLLALFVVIFTLQFFRDPKRTPPQKENIVISPCDGKVVIVKDVIDNNFFKGAAKQVSIFMSPLNVHVNRIPISGKVILVKYIKGEYLVAFDHSCGERNERTEIGIDNGKIKVFFKQISGYVARRIIYNLKENEEVKIGERFGMIKFGSRVDMFLPPDVRVSVKEGEIARAGETIIAEY
jgi:phosphatidylserine decarboxylase